MSRATGHQAADGASGLRLLHEAPVHVVLTDLRMPGLDGLEVLQQVKALGLDVEVILLTAHASIDAAVAAMKHGAFDFLTKPPDLDRLLHLVRRAAERQSMVRRTQAFEAARADDAARPLVAESAAMPDTLIAHLESELFGYEKGAFTGAVRRKTGKFELADGGTLFLDEIAELAPPVQAKLLRVLQEREVERLGGTQPIAVDVRILAATNQDLRTLASDRRFRDDLYYRLNVWTSRCGLWPPRPQTNAGSRFPFAGPRDRSARGKADRRRIMGARENEPWR